MKNKYIIIFITSCILIISVFTAGLIYDYKVHNGDIERKNCIIDSLNNELDIKDSIIFNSISIEKYDTLIHLYNYKESLYNDSLLECSNVVDSLNEELLVCLIKLDRIKEYNRIAAQGNNITFLRGWINRVLND